jgi:hypothetical protein
VGFTNRSNLAPINIPITGNIGVLSSKKKSNKQISVSLWVV